MASASVRTRPAAGSTRSSSPGARRPVRTISPGESGTAPASDATATTRSAVSDQAAGRSPLRSSSAPTRRPSLNTNAPGPSHGATNPATRRRNAATAGCGVRRRAVASGTSASRALSSDQPVATSSSSASSRDRESLTPGESRGPAARSRSAASRRRLGMPASSRRPRTASRFPRTVLISPLCATNANGWASDQTGDVLVAYRWWNIANGTSIGRAEVREQLGDPPAGDQALVDDGPRGGGHDGERVHAQRAGARVRPASGTGERELEVGLRERGRTGDQRLLDDRQRCRGLAPERGRIERNASPDGRGQAFLGQGGLDDRP